ncbi:AraC family transcriptional regulator [Winogradskyella sp.]|uniref:helix-turn-helix domain-containing protein n=1 Tax=Winogradskyella sp. TaxID=1883156 RepID=UPI00263460E4|nr:helix-turn-helix transcriptional regulator [Winogradskyella sp.]
MKFYTQIQDLLSDWNIDTPLLHPDIFIFKIEDYFGEQSMSFGPYRHNFFELTFGIGHDVDIKIGTSVFKPMDASLSFTSPYQISSWRVNKFKSDSLGYMILFNPQLFGSTVNKITLYNHYSYLNLHTSPNLFLNETQQGIIVSLMQQLYKEYRDDEQKGYERIIASYLTILLEKIRTFFEESTTKRAFANRAEEITFLFENLLKEQSSYKNKMPYYASQLHISTSYLTEVVKRVTSKTPISIVQEYLVLKAKTLLSQNNKPIAVIADELGFNEASNFNKYFKKNTGLTPSAYRKLP